MTTILMTCLASCGQRIDSWKNQQTEEINAALANANHTFRQKVQERHLTVKVKEAKVSRIDVKTKHDFTWSGWNNSNIESFEVEITFTWDGIIHKNGQTILRICMTPGATKADSVKVIHTDAAINLGNEEEWQKLSMDVKSLFEASTTE